MAEIKKVPLVSYFHGERKVVGEAEVAYDDNGNQISVSVKTITDQQTLAQLTADSLSGVSLGEPIQHKYPNICAAIGCICKDQEPTCE
jgi:hypothetical protein